MSMARKKDILEEMQKSFETEAENKVTRYSKHAVSIVLNWCLDKETYISPSEWLKNVNEQEVYKEVK